ncbi:MAG: glycerol-3-phosphate dehydrogenase/oxidase [Phycisphaerae bacterium]|nr:glycerol-3-phosphate dehydrogenase/oxidase [Phycisphaerae bacterium]
MNRSQTIAGLTAAGLDVLVVGGGIVGAGIARDAAMRGLRVGLVEQHDFAYGTSSRSSRLLHGGLRYLAQGRVGLVREASIEKRVVHSIAPHLAEPLPFLFPTYECPPWATWAHWKLSIGVRLYDLLCSGRNLGKSTSLNAAQLVERLPQIRRQRLTGGVYYYDGLTSDGRLVLDTLRSAENAGGLVLNYCRMETSEPDAGGWRCRLWDRLSDTRFDVTARCVVNATGPWAPQIRHSRVRLRLTKGVHIVVDRTRLPVPCAVVMTDEKRILFAIPWGERVILGTTDTDYDGVIEDVQTDPEDTQYILDIVNNAFPDADLVPQDVIGDWAGLRPLIADPHGNPSDISRSHEIRSPAPGWWDVAGGKLTTYRLMAEQTVDRIGRHIGRKLRPCTTATVPLLGRAEAAGVSGIVPPPVSRDVVRHCCRNEWAVHLDDVMTRRTSWRFYFRDAGETAAQVARWMADSLGWDEERIAQEVRRYAEGTAHAGNGRAGAACTQ